MSDEEILSLPRAHDNLKEAAMRSLARMIIMSYYSDEKILAMNCLLKVLDLSFRVGVTESTVLALSGLAVLNLSIFDDACFGRRLANLSREFMKSDLNSKRFGTRITLLAAW